MDSLNVIGISGRMKSGKNEVAEIIKNFHIHKNRDNATSIKIVAFADPLKECLINTFGFERDDFYTQEGKMRRNPKWGMTHREILQKMGTEAIRNNLHKNAWIFAMDKVIRGYIEDPEVSLILIPDVRFANEAELIHSYNGSILNIERPSLITTSMKIKEKLGLTHKSEKPLPKKYIDCTIVNDSSLKDLETKVINWYRYSWMPELNIW